MRGADVNTVRTASLKTFLHKTLGGFADPPKEHWDPIVARLYPAGEKIAVIMAEADISAPTIYRSLERQGIERRLTSRYRYSLASSDETALA